jgi:hypothetical protein
MLQHQLENTDNFINYKRINQYLRVRYTLHPIIYQVYEILYSNRIDFSTKIRTQYKRIRYSYGFYLCILQYQ